MDYEEYKRKALEPIVNYIESVMASYSKEELEARIKKALPEKESEDERIRKNLIELLLDTPAQDIISHHLELSKVLAYLEKQKDQDVKVISWREPDDCADIPEGHYVVIAYKPGVFGLGYIGNGKVVCAPGQKPSGILYIPNADESIIVESKEQKPTEWSDNFEENIRKLLHDKLTWHSKDGSMSSAVFIDDKTLKDIISGIWFYVGKEALKYPSKELNVTEWSEDYREEDIQTRFAFYTYKDDPSVLYLSNVFVEETSRNHGFGTRILKAAEKAAEMIGAITICLKVKQDSPANAWYRKHGYGYVTFEDGYDWLKKNLEYLKPKQEQLEVDLEKFTEKIKTFHERYKYPEIVSIKGAMAFMARMFYQYPNAARQWYDRLPKTTMD